MYKIPKEISNYYDQQIVCMYAHNNRIFIFLPCDLKILEDEIAVRVKKFGTNYLGFYRFKRLGTHTTTINSDGQLELPQTMRRYIGRGKVSIIKNYVEKFPWIEISRSSPNTCVCEDIQCRKCILVSCKRKNCSTHNFHEMHRNIFIKQKS